MKILIDIPEQLYKDAVELDYMSSRCFNELKDAVKNGSKYGIEFPTGYVTNGEVFKTVYGQFIDILEYRTYQNTIEIVLNDYTNNKKIKLFLPLDWWVSKFYFN